MAVAPSEFPPPVDSAAEFVGPPTDDPDERIEVGVAIVGGGQAGMACAIRLLQLLEDDPELTERLGEVPVAVIEKGRVAGAHQLSGGVMNPSAIRELLPDDDSWPHFGEVKNETVYFCTKRRAFPLVASPPRPISSARSGVSPGDSGSSTPTAHGRSPRRNPVANRSPPKLTSRESPLAA